MKLAAFRTCILALALPCALAACATYDDTAMNQACTDSVFVKDLPEPVAARESNCRKGEIWSSERSRDDTPIDFSGRNKDR